MDKKIRVLHVAEAAGGVERYLETLFKYSKDKVENILVCSQNYDYEKFKKLADRIIVLKMAHDIEPSSDIKVERTLRRIIKQLKPDIVYAHSSKAGAFARIADLGLNNKVIYNPHGWAFNENTKGIKKKIKHTSFKIAEKVGANFTDKIICISDFEKNTALKNKIASKDKLKVIYSGIDFKEFERANKITRSDVGIPEDAFVIGNVARLTETKAPDTFVKAAKIIKKNIPNAFFVMVGNGDLQKKIESQIKADHLENCFLLTGWVDNPNDFMNLFDIGMLLSRWEGLGLVLLEYMLSEVPVIATNVGGIPNVVKNRKNGLLVLKDNINEIVKATLLLHNDMALRQELINSGLKDVRKRFNIKRTALETEEMYKKVIDDD